MIDFQRTRTTITRFTGLALLCIALGPITGALAKEDIKPKTSPKTAREEIKAFCANIADAARDQRYQLQKEELEKLQAQVDERITTLEKRKTEYESWLTKRNEFLKKADAGIVDIFKKMKPDAAAAQMELLDPFLASAIIMKLKPSQSSQILSEMDVKKAALVTATMSAAVDRKTSRNPS